MAGDTNIAKSDEEEGTCVSCKRGLNRESALTCVLCDGLFHKSCITRLKNTKHIANDKVVCCAGKVDPGTVICCIVGLVKEIESQKTELTLIKELLHETKEKNKLLEEKLEKIEKSDLKYSDVVKSKPPAGNNSDMRPRSTADIILKPKNNEQNNDKTLEDLRSTIKPEELKISVKSVRSIRNGGMAISCPSPEDASKLLKEINNKLDGSYNAKMSQLMKPKIKIVGYQPREHEDNHAIEQKIINQNDLELLNETLTITYISERPNKKTIIYAEVSPTVFRTLISRKKLYIGWERFPVYEDITINRCHKCQSYGHKQHRCTRNIVCSYCSGNHLIGDCPRNSKKCINCINTNRKYQLKQDVQHETNDLQCPTYLYHIKRYKSRVDYGE